MRKEDNELLTKVGAGTPMGELFRQYQIPVLLSKELKPDGPPKRVRLLGEDLIGFRTRSGKVGLVGEACQHRCASLYFGRIEEDGMRCIYHGWKYGLDGACLDMPNVSPEHQFKERIHQPAYPCVERCGIIWTYMGPAREPPPVPDLEFLMVPEENRYVEHRDYQECNYFQALEGGIDPAHAAFLHGPLDWLSLSDENAVKSHNSRLGADQDLRGTFQVAFATGERRAHVEALESDYGVILAARRNAKEAGKYLWRTNHFLMPFYTIPPGLTDDLYLCHIWVPVDDEHLVNWRPQWNPFRPLSEEDHRRFVYEYLPSTVEAYGDIRLSANKSNNYFMDWEIHRTRKFGIPTIHLEDVAITESQGRIFDRSKENLTESDIAIIAVRDRLLNAAQALRDRGELPPGLRDAGIYSGIRGASLTLPTEASWLDYMKHQQMAARASS